MQPCVCASTEVVECSTSKQLPRLAFFWSLLHLSFSLCERSSQWTEQTERLNYKRPVQ